MEEITMSPDLRKQTKFKQQKVWLSFWILFIFFQDSRVEKYSKQI